MGKFYLILHLENNYRKSNKRKDENIICSEIKFKYMANELAACVDDRITDRLRFSLSKMIPALTPATYRVKVFNDKLYINASFKIKTDKATDSLNGTVGVDFNKGFLEAVEIDRQGNILNINNYPLKFHGTGNKAKTEMQEIVSEIMYHCRVLGKDLIIEDLNFDDKKSKTIANDKKEYNAMLHTLDYSRFKKICKTTGTRAGVTVITVDPYNTSKIGKEKYAKQRKLTTHQAAAYVIARRGKGFDDELKTSV